MAQGYRRTPYTFRIELEPDKVRKELATALYKTHGNMARAAKALGLSRATLYSYCTRLKIEMKR